MGQHQAGQQLTREEVQNACKLGSASAYTALRNLDEATAKGRKVAIFYDRALNYFSMHEVRE